MTIKIEQLLPKLQRTKEYDNYYSAVCPFHDDHNPSLLVYKSGWFRCLGCGKSGDFYSLHRKLIGWTSASLDISNELADFKIPQADYSSELFAERAHKTLSNFSESLAWYLRMRKLEDQIIPQQIGWHNGWYTFPVYNFGGEYTGVVMRASKHIQEATNLRYVIKTKEHMYYPDWFLARTGKYLVITFGVLDAITLTKLRIPACSTLHGKVVDVNSLDWARKPIIIFPDKDEENKAMYYATKLGWRGKVIRFDYPDGTKDPNDVMMIGKEIDLYNTIERAGAKLNT